VSEIADVPFELLVLLEQPLVLRAHGGELIGHLGDPGAQRADGVGRRVRVRRRGLGHGLHHGRGLGLTLRTPPQPDHGDHDHHDARQDEGEGIGARIHQRPLQDSPKASANGRAEMR